MDEATRYVEYLQRQMLVDGWEGTFDAERVRARSTTRMKEMRGDAASADALIREFERVVCEHTPTTRFDAAPATLIFLPLLDRVQAAALKLGLRPTRDVRLAASTEIGPSPLARPSSGEHLLFIGLGTSTYCNYWAKAYTEVAYAVSTAKPGLRRPSIEDLLGAGAEGAKAMVLVSRLATFYGMFGTLLPFGPVDTPREHLRRRTELLNAMELFAVAHEFAHFVAHERFDVEGPMAPEKSRELELFCDELGMTLCRTAASDMRNFPAYTGVGALALFRSLQLCERAARIFREQSPGIPPAATAATDATHPKTNERIALVREVVFSKTPSDQLEDTTKSFEFFETLTAVAEAVACETMRAIKAQDDARKA